MIFSETIRLKDEVSDPAAKAQSQVKLLSSALDMATAAMTKAQALGNVSAFRKSQQDIASLNAALAQIPKPVDKAKAAMDQLKTTADGKIKFSVEGTEVAKKAAESLKSSLEGAKQKMAEAAALGDSKAFSAAHDDVVKYSTALQKLPAPDTKPVSNFKDSWANAAHAIEVGKETIGAAFEGIATAAKSLAAGDVKGAVQGVTDTVAGLAKTLDLVAPGLGEVASTVIKIAGGMVGITAGLLQDGAKMAIEATTAKTAMLSMFDALGQGVISGQQVDDMLDGMRSKLGVTKDAMVPLVKNFMAMGVTGQDALERMTTAALSAKALMGGSEEASQAFMKLTEKIHLAAQTGQQLKLPLKGLGSLAEMGVKVDDVAKKMGISAAQLGSQLKSGSVDAAKFGDALNSALIEKGKGPLEEMSMSLPNLVANMKSYIGDMFEDMKEPVYAFLGQVKDLFSIFDSKTKPSGMAMKDSIEGVFKRVLTVATKLVPMVKHFLLDMIIYGLKAYISLKPIVKTVQEFFQSATGSAALSFVLDNLLTVFKTIGIAIVVVVGLFGVLATASVAMGLAIWTAIGYIVSLAEKLTGGIRDATTFATKALIEFADSAIEFGKRFIEGLVKGITNGASAVADSVKNVANGAIDTFKNVLGIHSPSTVGIGLTTNVTDSMATGFDRGTKTVSESADKVASAAIPDIYGGSNLPASKPQSQTSPAVAATSSAMSGSSQESKTIIQVDVGGIHLSNGGKSGGPDKTSEELTEEAVALIFERVALEQGL